MASFTPAKNGRSGPSWEQKEHLDTTQEPEALYCTNNPVFHLTPSSFVRVNMAL